jgi:hypothetical protein
LLINGWPYDLFLDVKFDVTDDLQHVLDDDYQVLQQQIETLKLEQLRHQLRTSCERMKISLSNETILTSSFFAGPNASCGIYVRRIVYLLFISNVTYLDADLIKPHVNSSLRLLKAYESRIVTMNMNILLQQVDHI